MQLVELLEVRHSVFIIGLAGTGKSEVWKTLYRTYSNLKLKPFYNDIEPKAVTNDELFGIISPATREWVDGKSILITTVECRCYNNELYNCTSKEKCFI